MEAYPAERLTNGPSSFTSVIIPALPICPVEYEWDEKLEMFTIYIGIPHDHPWIQRSGVNLIPVLLCEQTFKYLDDSDGSRSFSLRAVRTFRILCSAVRQDFASPTAAAVIAKEEFLPQVDAARARETLQRTRPNNIPVDQLSGLPRAFAFVAYAELCALVVLFPNLGDLVLHGVIADVLSASLVRVAPPAWLPEEEWAEEIALDTLVIDLSLDLVATVLDPHCQAQRLNITHVLCPLALFKQVDRLILRNAGHVVRRTDDQISFLGPYLSQEGEVGFIGIDISRIKHLHIKGDFLCQSVLQEIAKLAQGGETGQCLQTLEIEKLYKADMSALRDFVHKFGGEIKRMIFELMDQDYDFGGAMVHRSGFIYKHLQELSLRVTRRPRDARPEAMTPKDTCRWYAFYTALRCLVGEVSTPRLHTLRLEVKWRPEQTQDRTHISALKGPMLRLAAPAIESILEPLLILGNVHIYGVWPDEAPCCLDESATKMLFPNLRMQTRLAIAPMQTMHWHGKWAPWI